MKTDKFYELAQSLSYKEWKGFGRFLKSPYFGKNERAELLYTTLFSAYPSFPPEETTPKKLYASQFGNTPFQATKLHHIFSDLTKLLLRYLAQLDFDRSPAQQRENLLHSLHQRELDKPFTQKLKQHRSALEALPYRDIEYYELGLRTEEEALRFSASRDNRGIDTGLQQLSEFIDLSFLTRKLKYSCEIINRMNVLQVQYDTSFLDKIEAYLKEHPYEEVPAVHLYYTILLTLRYPEEETHYHTLKADLRQHDALFSREEMRHMYAFLQNYCIRRANLGNLNFLDELFEAYVVQLEAGILYDQGHLSQFDFKNIVTVALRTSKLDWAERFVEEEHDKLRKEQRVNAYTYNLARLRFSRQAYKDCRKLLLSVEFTDVYYYLDARSLLIKTYFELDDFEPLFSLAQTFRTYLHRNRKVSSYQKQIYLQFIKFTLKLSRVKLGSRKPVQEIQAEMEAEKQVADLTWLQEKVGELG